MKEKEEDREDEDDEEDEDEEDEEEEIDGPTYFRVEPSEGSWVSDSEICWSVAS